MKFHLANDGGQEHDVRVVEVTAHDPDLISKVVEIDLMTFSEPTWSRYTAGLMLRHGRTFLLLADDRCIGTCQCLRSWQNVDEVVLFSMAIRPGWRGQGLGAWFLQGVVDRLHQSRFRSVVLEVDPANTAAIRLYEDRFGFRVVSRCEQEYGPGHDRVHMRLELDPPHLQTASVIPIERPGTTGRPGGSGDTDEEAS